MELRPELPELPERIKRLPVDPDRGYPVPWFVAWVDGKPDFRVIGPQRRETAVQENRCWVCGQPMGVYKAFAIGPMCAVNRVSAEPPSHLECAEFSAMACPFLVRPHARRRPVDGIVEGVVDADGIAIARNPGVVLIWVTKKYFIIPDHQGGWLIRVGPPTETRWYAEGRAATRAEVEASIESGLPILREMAEQDGPEAVLALAKLTEEARKHLPSAIVLA